ncbi:hypothetical protein [Pseudomonas cyclaminis]|uniref:hypothetical protein n=1 Tax=Pseudomonas cyclaminis TaxID=2781239 RepID=UPI0037F8A0C5
MTFETAEIVIYPGSDERITLKDVPFHFNPGERNLDVDIENTDQNGQEAGWLGIRAEPFKHWQLAHIISVTGNKGTDLVLEVSPNCRPPVQDGDWLWFNARPGQIVACQR